MNLKVNVLLSIGVSIVELQFFVIYEATFRWFFFVNTKIKIANRVRPTPISKWGR